MENNFIIRLAEEKDYKETENLTREAFWNVYRPGCVEHYVLHRFRDRPDFVKQLDYVMEKDGKLIGHIMYSRAQIKRDGGGILNVMTFGPFSILPEYQKKGYGSALLNFTMEKAKELGAHALAITGNIEVYGKSGFFVAKNFGIRYEADPDADYFLIKELVPDCLKGVSGTYADPDGYFVDEIEAEKFDKEFCFKEKKILSGQIFN